MSIIYNPLNVKIIFPKLFKEGLQNSKIILSVLERESFHIFWSDYINQLGLKVLSMASPGQVMPSRTLGLKFYSTEQYSIIQYSTVQYPVVFQ